MPTSAVPRLAGRRATLVDLAHVDGKAELIGGRVVHQMPTGHLPNRVADRIFRSLDDHAEQTGHGVAYTDSMGFAIPELASGRESFSPDASSYAGALPDNLMKFVQGAPTFAVEVRSESDYGPAAEAAMAARRTDYFAAGTLVLWDVDPIARSIRKFEAGSPSDPVVFTQGLLADAEPAVPSWRMAVDQIFI